MSSKKRRIKRKLAMLRKLDETHLRRYLMYRWKIGRPINKDRDSDKAKWIWFNCIIPLGDALQRKGIPAWQSFARLDGERTSFLLQRFKERNPGGG